MIRIKGATVKLAPSVLSADFGRLGEQVAEAEAAGADYIHVDVMDGHFVPNLTVGPLIVEALRPRTRLPLDVHLMITEPEQHLEAYAEAGASMISVHVEASPHLHQTLTTIKQLGAQAGAALNPSTPAGTLEAVADLLDFALVMSVNPGLAGQTFIQQSESKIRTVRTLLDRAGNSAPVEIDGGIQPTNAARVVQAGAEILVAATAIFGAQDPAAATRQLREAALEGTSVSQREPT